MAIPDKFAAAISSAERDLMQVSETQANERVTPSGWTRKHVLGHLLDSCVNNHFRFVHAAVNFSYNGPDYHQQDWVALHDYQRMSWSKLVDLWVAHNELLSTAVRNIPEGKYSAPCKIGDDDPVTLGFLIEDYLRHLEHHMRQLRVS